MRTGNREGGKFLLQIRGGKDRAMSQEIEEKGFSGSSGQSKGQKEPQSRPRGISDLICEKTY